MYTCVLLYLCIHLIIIVIKQFSVKKKKNEKIILIKKKYTKSDVPIQYVQRLYYILCIYLYQAYKYGNVNNNSQLYGSSLP